MQIRTRLQTLALRQINGTKKYPICQNCHRHREDRVLSFSPVVRIGAPPPPHTQAGAGEGVGESQFGRGDRHRGTLGIYVLYFVVTGLKTAILAELTRFHPSAIQKEGQGYITKEDPYPLINKKCRFTRICI